jgi:hypothetical protein
VQKLIDAGDKLHQLISPRISPNALTGNADAESFKAH